MCLRRGDERGPGIPRILLRLQEPAALHARRALNVALVQAVAFIGHEPELTPQFGGPIRYVRRTGDHHWRARALQLLPLRGIGPEGGLTLVQRSTVFYPRDDRAGPVREPVDGAEVFGVSLAPYRRHRAVRAV